MAVKRSQSAARMLRVFETVVRTQPAGVSAIARELEADKSAVQRDLMTLADAGWIRNAPGGTGQWELTAHVMTLAKPPFSSAGLRDRARPVMADLRAATGETIYLAIPDRGQFVVIEAVESQQVLRMVPPVGMRIPVQRSATAQTVFAHMSPEQIVEFSNGAGKPLPATDRETVLQRGYAVNDGEIVSGSVTMAAAVLDEGGRPAGAIVVSGPSDRLTPARIPEIGARLREAAQSLSAL